MSDNNAVTASFDEIRTLVRELPGPDLAAKTAAVERLAALKASGTLGRLEDLWIWLATWQGRPQPRIDHPRVCIFAGNHGIAARQGSRADRKAAAQSVRDMTEGRAGVHRLSNVLDADLRVFEMALDRPTRDFTESTAMSENDCARAMAYGMMAVEPGLDVICLGTVGDGSAEAAAVLGHLLFEGGEVPDEIQATGPIIAKAVARHRAVQGDPLKLLAAIGGHELAAVAGAIMAARLARIPVIIGGHGALAAASVVWSLDRRGVDHCVVAHARAEDEYVLERLGQRALLDFAIDDDGASAALLIPLLRTAIACYAESASA
jgi:nicotinate-nucleotide--dimethylbenzimidazole phosphoribosyltransferase